MARQVIVGNSAASLSAIKAIREVALSCPITLISAENCSVYSPVLLTYYLAGRISREELFVVDGDFYQDMGIETIFGSKVFSLRTIEDAEYEETITSCNQPVRA